ncbi:hypothetical protein CC2G_005023 [Coprinopsis cinerea AmutBmut pab1-1]|nr:hypothetical protein CC2G_005023 [Coprinopsis cinerea AmutBmut pab1-1]
MVLKRKRGDEWVEVKPRRGSSSPAMIPPIPAPATSIPTTTTTSRATRSSAGTTAGPSLIERHPTTSTMGYSYNYADRAPVTPVKKARLASDSPEIVAVSSGGYRSGSSLNMPGRSTNTTATTTTSRTAARRAATTQVSQHPSLGRPPPSTLYQPPPSQPPPPTKTKATRKGKKKAVEEEYGHAPGSSQPGSSQPSSSQGARGRKPAPEKRLARFKPSCPQNIIDRLERVQMQTFYMLDRNRNGDELKETFQVSGSTGNVYTVVIDKIPSCTCPDAMKGNHCKHILFIFTKVLHVPRSSGSWYQKALLTDELQEIFDNAPAAPNAGVTNARVQEAYLRSIGRAPSQPASSQQSKKKTPEEGDDCPICYDTMYRASEAQLVWCEECGNAVHKGCWGQWSNTARASGKDVTCVWCRSKWTVAGAWSFVHRIWMKG